MSDIPNGWTEAELRELVPHDGLMTDGDWVESKDQDPNGDVRLIQLADIGDGGFRNKSARYLTKRKAIELGCTYLKQGDVLIARMPDPLGRACLFPLSGEEKFVTVVDVCVLRLSGETVSSRYITYLINSGSIRQQIESFESGTTRKRISGKNLAHVRLPIAPLAEQRRIVAKIEELFSELDEGVANLKKARAQLAVYRQALLKHAFEGHLTADWRAQHADQLESADQLLARIRKEREARYQQQIKEWEVLLAEWERMGGKTTKPSKPGKPVPQSPISEDTQKTLPNLPKGWAHLRLGELIDEPAYGTSKKCDYETKGTGVLRIPNVVSGSIDATDLKFASFTPEEVEGYALEVGDLLMIRSNGSVSIVGRCALIRDKHTKLLYAGYLIRLRPHASSVNGAFLHRQLLSHALRHQIEQAAKSTSGVNNINSGEIQSLIIAVCSVAEQEEIVVQLEEKLSAVSTLEADIDLNLQKAEALRQSILKKAFVGELVPQDPADEPASELLARIRAEREAQAATAPKKTSRPRKKQS